MAKPRTLSNTVSNGGPLASGSVELPGGETGSIPYQAAAGDTAMLAPGTAGQALLTQGAGSPPVWGMVAATQVQAVASGAIADGASVVINSDGTVSAVTGAPMNLIDNNANVALPSYTCTYNAANNTVVAFYWDNPGGVSAGAYGVVGTISGSTITFGTPVLVTPAGASVNDMTCGYDPVNQKILLIIRYNNPSITTNAVVITVSGTTLSVGTAVAMGTSTNIEPQSLIYDTANSCFVFAYCYTPNFYPVARVVTISGTTPTWGAEATADTTGSIVGGSTGQNRVANVYDSTAQKFILTYYISTANASRAVVGTVSGTTITFGTPVTFYSGNIRDQVSVYSVTNNKTILFYRNQTVSGYGYYTAITVIGTTPSFGTNTAFNSDTQTYPRAAIYCPSLDKTVLYSRVNQALAPYGTLGIWCLTGTFSGTSISLQASTVILDWTTESNSGDLYAVRCSNISSIAVMCQGLANGANNTLYMRLPTEQNPGRTNLFPSNFIGFANGAYSNGQTATIQTIGALNTGQSGLTVGLTYYIDPLTGSLSTTSTLKPSISAGAVMSASSIIVKG